MSFTVSLSCTFKGTFGHAFLSGIFQTPSSGKCAPSLVMHLESAESSLFHLCLHDIVEAEVLRGRVESATSATTSASPHFCGCYPNMP